MKPYLPPSTTRGLAERQWELLERLFGAAAWEAADRIEAIERAKETASMGVIFDRRQIEIIVAECDPLGHIHCRDCAREDAALVEVVPGNPEICCRCGRNVHEATPVTVEATATIETTRCRIY